VQGILFFCFQTFIFAWWRALSRAPMDY
jgi:hypothetical protein